MLRGISSVIVVAKANEVLAQFITDAIEKYAQAVYFKNGFLMVASLSPAVTREIKLRTAEIIAAINQSLEQNEVRQIKFLD